MFPLTKIYEHKHIHSSERAITTGLCSDFKTSHVSYPEIENGSTRKNVRHGKNGRFILLLWVWHCVLGLHLSLGDKSISHSRSQEYLTDFRFSIRYLKSVDSVFVVLCLYLIYIAFHNDIIATTYTSSKLSVALYFLKVPFLFNSLQKCCSSFDNQQFRQNHSKALVTSIESK